MTIMISGKDEIAQIGRKMDETVAKLSMIIGNIIDTSKVLSKSVSAQVEFLEQASCDLDEIFNMTQDSAAIANDANKRMKEANQVVSTVNDAINSLMRSMNEISVANEETTQIVKTIDAIAFQTNLLALNASVEAARAGDLGDGFSVVASEVRNLSVRSTKAAGNAANLIEDTTTKIRHGYDLLNHTNESSKKLTIYAAESADLVNRISEISNKKYKKIKQINRAIHEIKSISRQNAGRSEDLASSMRVFKISHTVADD